MYITKKNHRHFPRLLKWGKRETKKHNDKQNIIKQNMTQNEII